MSYLGLAIPLALVSLTGLLLNTYILVVVILTRQAASANNLLLLHLGAVDALLGALFLAFSVPGLSRGGWLVAGAPCTLHGFLFTLLHPLALWTICGLNCDRYYAIAAPLHYGHLVSPRKVLLGLGAGWLGALLLCVPPLFTIAPYRYAPGLGACAPDFSIGSGALWYSALYTAFTLLLPAVLIICCNLKILMIARYHRHRIASAIFEVTLSAQVTITHQRNPFFHPTVTAPSHGGPKFRGRSAISTVLQLLVSFVVLYFPYYVLIVWEAGAAGLLAAGARASTHIHPHIFTIASTLLTCSPPINGFLYGVKSKTLRKTFRNYWRKKISKSEVQQEIQARTPSTCGSRRPSLTPLGFFIKPTLQRRLSEALLEVQRNSGNPQKPNIKRIASEMNWRPNSITQLNLPIGDDMPKRPSITHTASCNTLQVPRNDGEDVSTIGDDEIYLNFLKKHKEIRESLTGNNPITGNGNKPGLSTTNLLLQRVFGMEAVDAKKATVIKNVLDSSPKRSPRILITRAFSEESDKSPSIPVSPARKFSSSTTTLLERKWRQIRYRDEDSDSDTGHRSKCSQPLLGSLRDSSNFAGNRSSDSSETSETSSGGAGKIYMALDDRGTLANQGCADQDSDGGGPTEDQLLLSWPTKKHHHQHRSEELRKSRGMLLVRQALGEVQAQEIVL